MANYSDLGVIYNHPSVMSTISNNDTIFQSSVGRRPFFYVITSDKGEDNKIKLMSDEKEYIFNYGEPNLKKHGQAAYNILNILQAKENVYVLRAMPEDAGYSHAFLNIQTKLEGVKKVKNINGELIELSNVITKPTVTYTKANNISKELLDFELLNERNELTVDGYKNNLLFYIVPKGRGEYYDKYGFRIYLNHSYDESYDFRVYNFEVIEYDEYSNARAIEGPFYVSLDPDAISSSNESMFIEDVINRYSQYVNCKFNVEAYDNVAALINSDVHPSHLDLITGQTRLFNNEPENYFCKETQKYEDVHIKLQKYDNNGVVITSNGKPLTNIVDSSDKVEQSVISIDNNVRDGKYKRNLASFENMKMAIADIYNGLYENTIKSIALIEEDNFTPDCALINAKGEVDTAWRAFKEAYQKYTSNDKGEIDFISAFAKSTALENKVDSLKKIFVKLTDYARVINDDTYILNIINNLDNLQIIKDTKEVVSIKLLNYKSKLNEFISNIVRLKTLQSTVDETEGMKLILVELGKILNYFMTMTEDDTLLTETVELYNKLVNEAITQLEDEFTPDETKIQILIQSYKDLDNIITSSLKIANDILLTNEYVYGVTIVGDIEKVMREHEGATIYAIMTALLPVLQEAIKKYKESIKTSVSKSELLEGAKKIASIQQEATVKSKSLVYTTLLQNFNSPIRFSHGSDGSLATTVTKERNKIINNLLIKGYKGLLDSDITNKKKIPARFILDANYDIEVKNAMTTLITDIRDDIFFYADLGFTASPEEALNIRKGSFNISTNKAAIYAQDATVYDEFNGRDMKVTATYFLANKVPKCSREYGLHFPIAGNRRGVIDGFKNLSWIPNETYKEKLYMAKVNYIESDERRTKFGSQLTSETRNTPLSNINNVITVIDIKNDVEVMAEDYQFELNDQDTINVFQNELNDYLAKYISSKAVETVNAVVYASDYDKQQKILRVTITIKFHDIIERIIVNLDVVK